MNPDPQIRQDLLDVLGDLPLWRLNAGAWQAVAAALDKHDQAACAGQEEALVRLTVALETLSPSRLLPLDLSYPPPRSLRLRADRLVHALTERSVRRTTYASPRPEAPPDGVTGVRQELVVHAFA